MSRYRSAVDGECAEANPDTTVRESDPTEGLASKGIARLRARIAELEADNERLKEHACSRNHIWGGGAG